MNKSSRQYHRRLTTNSYNQEFTYYKQQRQKQNNQKQKQKQKQVLISKSPKFQVHKKQKQSNKLTDKDSLILGNDSNHNKIQTMKNTLQSLYVEKNISSKGYNKSLIEYPTYDMNMKNYQKQINVSKSVYGNVNEQNSLNSTYNNKLEMLTTKLRQIASKPYFYQTNQQHHKSTHHQNSTTRTVSYSQKNHTHQNKVNSQKKTANQNNQKDKYNINQQSKSTYLANHSQDLSKSRNNSSSCYDNIKNNKMTSISQTTSLRRNPKQLKNQKSVSTFQYQVNLKSQEDTLQRPRGKTMANLISQTQMDAQNAKIKINSYLESSKNTQRYTHFDHLTSLQLKKSTKNLVDDFNRISKNTQNTNKPNTISVLQPHRASIKSIIINSDGKRFLTASNDYSLKETSIDGSSQILRKHEGRVNVIRMIENRLYSGSNDCKIKYQQNGFENFRSPVLQIFPHEKQWLNVGTSSSIQLYNLVKKKSDKIIEVKTKFYQIFQKINKQVCFSDNHNLSIIDWRVPSPLINIIEQKKYVSKWISNPYSNDFFQIIDNHLVSLTDKQQKSFYLASTQIKDYTWKKDKLYILSDDQFKTLEIKDGQIKLKQSFTLNPQFGIVSTLQVKNDIWTYGTLDGKLIVNRFQ